MNKRCRLIKLVLTSAIINLVITNCHSQSLKFERFIYSPQNFVSAVESSNQDGYFAVTDDHHFFKMNITGNIQSVYEFPSTVHATKLEKTKDNNLVMLCHRFNDKDYLIKIDTLGNILWCKEYDIYYGGGQFTIDLYLTPDSGFMMVGTTSSPSAPFVLKTDKNGNLQWVKVYTHSGATQVFRTVRQDQYGNYYVQGRRYAGHDFINKLDSAGNLLWTKGYRKLNNPTEILDYKYDSLLNNFMIAAHLDALIQIDTSGSILIDKELSNYFPNGKFIVQDSRTLLIGDSPRGFRVFSFDSIWNPIEARTYAWNSNQLDTINYILKDVAIGTSDNGLLILGNYFIDYGMGGPYQALLMKLDDSLNSACHTFPDSIQIISNNVYVVDTLVYQTVNSNSYVTNYPISFTSSIFTDSTVCNPTFIDELLPIQDKVVIYPNPVLNKLNIITNNQELSEIILYDIYSKKIIQEKFTNSILLNTEKLAQGIYLYEVRCGSSLCKKGKLVKD